jgi:hypothetical protein
MFWRFPARADHGVAAVATDPAALSAGQPPANAAALRGRLVLTGRGGKAGFGAKAAALAAAGAAVAVGKSVIK